MLFKSKILILVLALTCALAACTGLLYEEEPQRWEADIYECWPEVFSRDSLDGGLDHEELQRFLMCAPGTVPTLEGHRCDIYTTDMLRREPERCQ